MTVLAALLVAQTPATAADFFPLVPGTRRIYEEKSKGTVTVIDEVGDKPAFFDDRPATPVVQKSQFNQVLGTTYYRVDGPMVLMVGSAEDRRASTPNVGDTVDLTRRAEKKNVLMQFRPAMPVFKYEGKETTWAFADVPVLQGPSTDAESIKMDPTSIRGVAKPGKERTVLGRKVETIEVRADVQLGTGGLAQTIVETSVYGRGIGLIESVRKTSGGGQKPNETRTRLVGIEDKKDGG